jgi:hypothetical protein
MEVPLDLNLQIRPLVTFAQLELTVRLTLVYSIVLPVLSVSFKVLSKHLPAKTVRKVSTVSVETLVL